jgi:HTH-type transcriptional regulator / antitoxin HigA
MIEHDIDLQDWLSPPCDSILEALEERGWTHAEFAERMDLSKKHINNLLKDRVAITAELADKLSRVIGSTPHFWLSLQSNYDVLRVRRAAKTQAALRAGWLDELPLSWLRKLGFLDATRDAADRVLQCLAYFGVANHEAWKARYAAQLVAFRTTEAYEQKIGAVAAWMRAAELEAMGELPPYDKAGLRDALHALRDHTDTPDLDAALALIKARCAAHGVAVVFVPSPPKCPVSGATCWLSADKALIVLTDRYKRNDTFWFTFFHEAAHILLHRKELIIEGMGGLDERHEAEADGFASDLLIPPKHYKRLKLLTEQGPLSKEQVSSFAAEIGIAPGVVVGRLQHDGLLPPNNMNKLKQVYTSALS